MNRPYSPPMANLNTQNGASYEPAILSFKGRIGRLRYLAFATVVCVVPLMLLGIFAAIMVPMFAMGNSGVLAMGLGLIAAVVWLGLIVFVFGLMRRRLHDLGRSGWFMLLLLIPIVNLLFGLYILFAPGDSGSNAYGQPPSPNPTWVTVVAVLSIILNVVIPLLSIPAYVEYAKKISQARGPVGETRPVDLPAPADTPVVSDGLSNEAVKPAEGGDVPAAPAEETTPGPRN